MGRRGAAAAACLALAIWLAAGAAGAQEKPSRDAPVLLNAEHVTYDQEFGVITARGAVEISQEDRVLLADTVSYNERTGTVTASGNVRLMEPGGEVLFADYVELTDQMRNGFIRDVRLLLADDSRAAAVSGVRKDGNRTVLDRAVYSPCDSCPETPERAPLWQVKADTVTHDQAAQMVEYRHAWFEMFGVPVAYTPYFSHPDPDVKRKSGFLPPTFSSDSRLGFAATIPYFFALAPHRDVTLSPIFTGEAGVVLAGEYRERTETGIYQFDGSITRAETWDSTNLRTGGQEYRGHIRGEGRFRLDESWDWGFDVFRSSDDTYLRRYHFTSEDTLTSNIYLEGIRGRNYAAANAYSFQGLLQGDDSGTTPIVLPLLDYSYLGQPNSTFGGYLTLDANVLALHRSEGQDTRRLSSTIGWTRPYIAPAGGIYTATLQLRGDVYWVNEGADPTGTTAVDESGTAWRVMPLAALDWRYPMVRTSGTVQQVIEPIAAVVLTPYGGNPEGIPNEDSRNFEFDDTNLFALNRFPGLDRYEGGPRLSYGFRAALYGLSGGYAEFLFGQSIRAKDDDSIPTDSGLDSRLSDYVGRLTLAPSALFDLSHRFRIDRQTAAIRRNEIVGSFGPSYLRLSLGYVQLDREMQTAQFGDREEITVSASAQLNRNWQAFGGWRHDLEDGGSPLNSLFGLRYLDECFDLILSVDRSNTRDRDIEPSTSFNIRVRLRNLG